jgi:hypothetical protein
MCVTVLCHTVAQSPTGQHRHVCYSTLSHSGTVSNRTTQTCVLQYSVTQWHRLQQDNTNMCVTVLCHKVAQSPTGQHRHVCYSTLSHSGTVSNRTTQTYVLQYSVTQWHRLQQDNTDMCVTVLCHTVAQSPTGQHRHVLQYSVSHSGTSLQQDNTDMCVTVLCVTQWHSLQQDNTEMCVTVLCVTQWHKSPTGQHRDVSVCGQNSELETMC